MIRIKYNNSLSTETSFSVIKIARPCKHMVSFKSLTHMYIADTIHYLLSYKYLSQILFLIEKHSVVVRNKNISFGWTNVDH